MHALASDLVIFHNILPNKKSRDQTLGVESFFCVRDGEIFLLTLDLKSLTVLYYFSIGSDLK